MALQKKKVEILVAKTPEPTFFGVPRKAFCRQLFMVLTCSLTVIASGMSLPFPGIMWEYLVDPKEPVHTTDTFVGLFASMTPIGQPFGALLVSLILDRFGRKRTLAIANILSFSAYVILASAIKIELISYLFQLMLARFIMGVYDEGISTGFAVSTVMIYASEISHPKTRGFLTSINPIAITIGNVIMFSFGYFLRHRFRTISAIVAIIILCAFFIQLNLVDSPSWLLLKGKQLKARQSFKYFRGYSENDLNLSEECEKEFIKMKENARKNRLALKKKFSFRKEIRSRDVFMPFIILTLLCFLQNFSGLFIILVFFIQMAKKAGIETLDPYLMGICVGSCRLVTTVIQAPFLDKLGRRLPALLSSMGMAICMISITIGNIFRLYISELIPLFGLLLFVILSSIGMFFIPVALCSELYPQRVRGKMVGITLCTCYCYGFTSIQIFAVVYSKLSLSTICGFFGIVSCVAFVFILIFVPETKGKTLAEIEEIFIK